MFLMLVSLLLSWKKETKDIFYNLRQLTQRKLNLSCTYFNSLEGQESCNSLVKNNFVRATFQKFVSDSIRKNIEASRNCCIIYLKSKHLYKHCIYNESWLKRYFWQNRKGMALVCLYLHFIVTDDVFYNCLSLLSSYWF